MPVGGGGGDYRVHVWSVGGAANFRYFATEHWGGYAIAGGGLYHKRILYSRECTANELNCYPGVASTVIADAAPGFDLGGGFMWRIADHSNAKAFFEARYVRTGLLPSGYFSVTGVPQTEHMVFVPVRGGIRW